jgi:hypothetical protein
MYKPPQHKELLYNGFTSKDLNIQTRTLINQHDIQNVIQIETEVRFHHFNYHNSFMFPNTVIWPNSEIVHYSYHLSAMTTASYVAHAIES